MKVLKKILAIILALNMLMGMIPNLGSIVRAASTGTVNVYVDSYDRGTGILTIRWDGITGEQCVRVEYLDPNTSSLHTEGEDNITSNSYTFETKLENDIIYAIDVKIYRPGDLVTPAAEGFLCFLPGITFRAAAVDGNSDYEDIDNIGREIGVKPALKLTWSVPSVFKDGTLVPADQDGAFSDIVDKMSGIYGKSINMNELREYTISVNRDDLGNNLVPLSDVIIKYNDAEGVYKANTSENSNVTSKVYGSGTGELSLYLVGRKDNTVALPATDLEKDSFSDTEWEALLPAELAEDDNIRENVLFDNDILPGTVYSMGIMPIYKDSKNLDVITVGDPEDDQQSPLTDIPYVFTALRFKLTKDELGNLSVIVYKINDGSSKLPNLIYEIQAGKASPGLGGDLPLLETIDDIYYPSGKAVYTSIRGIQPTNNDNYKVVAKSQAGQRISSWNMPFRLADYISGPPVPNDVKVTPLGNDVSIEVVNPQTGSTFIEKTTDVTISWKKPANWADEIEPNNDPAKDVYYHVLLCTNQTELSDKQSLVANGVNYGDFAVKYRRVLYFSSKAAVQDPDDPDRLMYTIKGDELFKYALFDGSYDTEGNPVIAYGDIPDDADTAGYPKFLLPNKVYYLQMFTTSGEHAANPEESWMSGYSDIKSFSTNLGAKQTVAIPYNFNYTRNDIDRTTKRNYIEFVIAEDDVDTESFVPNRSSSAPPTVNVYYELYMANPQSSTPASETLEFELIDTLPGSGTKSAPSIHVTVGKTGIPLLKPNTTYYFKTVTKLVIDEGEATETVIRSESSIIRSVTTLKDIVISPPDSANQRPLAPLDFTDKDDSGVSTVTGPSVTFSWTRQNDDEIDKDDVKYTVIATSARLFGNEELPEGDYLYDIFEGTLGSKLELLDPEQAPIEDSDIRFEFDNSNNKYRLTIKNWLDPNRLYFFSIRAVNGNKTSDWICIPVTTPLIPEPTNMEATKGYELGFYWNDTTAYMTPENYVIKIRKATDSNYREVPRSQSAIVKDGSTFYARVFGLEPGTSYDIKVYRGNDLMAIHPGTGYMTTRDAFHQIEVSWKGLPGGYRYELAIRAADEAEYTELTDDDLQSYTNSDGNSYPYYIEEGQDTAGNEYAYCHALIKTVRVTLPGGIVEHRPLKSNMKYFIKVRAVKISAGGDEEVYKSKYAGPVETRTSFSQDDYDDVEQDKEKEAKFLDRISRLEEGLYWRMNMESSAASKILVKGEKMVNAVGNDSNPAFTLDISEIDENINADVIYMPVEVIDTIGAENKNLVIRTDGGEFIFRPGTVDTGSREEFDAMSKKSGVKGLFLKMTVSRGEYPESSLPAGTKCISEVNELKLQVLGTSKTDKTLADLIHDRLYNQETGLIKAKLDLLSNPYGDNVKMTEKQLDQYIDMLVEDVEAELSEYIGGIVEGSGGMPGMVLAGEYVTEFDDPMLIRLNHNGEQGLKVPYAYYSDAKTWQKISGDTAASYGTVSFNVSGPGRYAVFSLMNALNDIPDDYWAKDSIDRFMSAYDLTGVFAGLDKSFNPEFTVSIKEIILLYDKVTGSTGNSAGTDIRKRAQRLGLDKLLNLANVTRDVSREETAAVLAKLYCTKAGVDIGSLKPGKTIFIADDAEIRQSMYNSVIICIDLGILNLDEDYKFSPGESVTRAEMITALVKLLELTGDIN